jgi:hypothetical protein
MKNSIFALSVLLILMAGFSKAQSYSFTLVPFLDANNNCSYDAGETMVQNSMYHPIVLSNGLKPYWVCNNCYMVPASSTITGTQNSPSPTFKLDDETLPYLQPCFVNNLNFNAVSYLPFVPNFDSFWHLSSIPTISSFQSVSAFSSPTTSIINQDTYTANICTQDNNLWVTELFGNPGGQCQTGTITTPYSASVTVKVDGNVLDVYSGLNMPNTCSSCSIPTYTGSSGQTHIIMSTSQPPLNTAHITRIVLLYSKTGPLFTAGMHTITMIASGFPGYPFATTTNHYFNVDSCGQMSGNAYIDCNNNCTKNFGEGYSNTGISSVNISNATNTITVSPDSYGNYSFYAPATGVYSVGVNMSPFYTLCAIPFNTINLNTAASSYTLNYGLKEGTVPTDYAAAIIASQGSPGPGAMPNGTFALYASPVIASAPNCTTFSSPQKLKVVLNNLMTYQGTIGNTPAPGVISCATGDTLLWNNPSPNANYMVKIGVSGAAVVGNLYSLRSIVYPLNDYWPTNNTSIYLNYFGGSFRSNTSSNSSMNASAPNVQNNGDIPPSTQEIDYTVQFQNNGSGIKNYVSILDTIDSDLDLSTLQVLYSSHPVQMQINTAARVVDFNFKNVALPPSSADDLKSRGFIRFKVKLLTGLPAGTQIKNRATVYLDYTGANSTNQTVNTIVVNAGLNTSEISRQIEMYPNPTKGNVTIKAPSMISKVEIINALGQTLLVKEVNADNTEIDMSNLAKGVYLVQMHTSGGPIIKKLVKE